MAWLLCACACLFAAAVGVVPPAPVQLPAAQPIALRGGGGFVQTPEAKVGYGVATMASSMSNSEMAPGFKVPSHGRTITKDGLMVGALTRTPSTDVTVRGERFAQQTLSELSRDPLAQAIGLIGSIGMFAIAAMAGWLVRRLWLRRRTQLVLCEESTATFQPKYAVAAFASEAAGSPAMIADTGSQAFVKGDPVPLPPAEGIDSGSMFAAFDLLAVPAATTAAMLGLALGFSGTQQLRPAVHFEPPAMSRTTFDVGLGGIDRATRSRIETELVALEKEDANSPAVPEKETAKVFRPKVEVLKNEKLAVAAFSSEPINGLAANQAGEPGSEKNDGDIRATLGNGVARRSALSGAVGAVGMASGIQSSLADSSKSDAKWVQYDLQTDETLYDIHFNEKNPDHGFVVGDSGLFYETKDGGSTWASRSFANLGKGDGVGSENINYRFQSVSANGNDVWILGKPSLLLHSNDTGKSWKKVALSSQLPGEPRMILSLGQGKAEMATTSGAIYVTENEGKHWKSIVKKTVDSTLHETDETLSDRTRQMQGAMVDRGADYYNGSIKSLERAPDGQYLAVSQRGNYYLTYTPGDKEWVPHNRMSARRIQAMGFRDAANGEPNGGAWMTLNGGFMTHTDDESFSKFDVDTRNIFNPAAIRTAGLGLMDVKFRTQSEGWAVGGSGTLYSTTDGGKTWDYDPAAKDLACNLYNVKFFQGGKVGYALGSNGTLLRKQFVET